MRRYIDADLLLAQCRRNPLFEKTEDDKKMIYIERSVIDLIPTADVVEVVRCKDCKYYKAYEPPIEDFDGFCTANENEYDKEFYCQYGERKDDGT